jgi:hypothetical protein
MYYSEPALIFNSIVENDSVDGNCLLPEESYSFFNKWGLDTVPIKRLGTYKTYDALAKALSKEYGQITSSLTKDEEKGSVIHFIKRDQKNDAVVSLGIIQTAESRILTSLLTKLRVFWK